MFGPLIVRSRPDDVSHNKDPVVDYDHTLVLNDWNHNYDSTMGKRLSTRCLELTRVGLLFTARRLVYAKRVEFVNNFKL